MLKLFPKYDPTTDVEINEAVIAAFIAEKLELQVRPTLRQQGQMTIAGENFHAVNAVASWLVAVGFFKAVDGIFFDEGLNEIFIYLI